MWLSSLGTKILCFLLLNAFIFCIYMDVLLYLRIQDYKIDTFKFKYDNSSDLKNVVKEPIYENTVWISCSINPLCHPTVKALMIDHVNHYIYGPLCAIVDIGLSVSKKMTLITPNMISFFHVFIALVGAKLLTCTHLNGRRIAILMFQIRMFLDDLDGHVARERQHIKGERSLVGTLGYFVDGICDLIGVVSMMVAITLFLRSNPPRRGYSGTPMSVLPYHQLKEINSTDDMEKDHSTEIGISYKTKVSFWKIMQVIGLFSGQMLLSSLTWNRYIDVFQELLENSTDYDIFRRETAFRSGVFFFTTGLWKIVNPHSYLHLLSLAVYFDKTWAFLRAVYLLGYIGLLVVVGITEVLLSSIHLYVENVTNSL